MKFTPALLFAGLVAAVPHVRRDSAASSGFTYHPSSTQVNATGPEPSIYENVDITDFSVRELFTNASAIDSVSFVVNGNTTCSASQPGNQVVVCGPSGATPWRFGVYNSTSTSIGLRIYKEVAPGAGLWGQGTIPTYCRSGGGSIEICDQASEVTIVISP